ncbi:hypothetical protein [Natronobiforma cellulositropha]|uniref:hypothetical protein n=1 Tax=Natronobiforma cellulositropha TaxID=1679076 RepID=UPI0021D60D89|nr:hypothetical protein [Natronobiforma cellulositropha]
MKSRVYCASLFALYQLTIALGIFVMPLAIAAHQVGYTLPIHRLLTNVGERYENAQATMA